MTTPLPSFLSTTPVAPPGATVRRVAASSNTPAPAYAPDAYRPAAYPQPQPSAVPPAYAAQPGYAPQPVYAPQPANTPPQPALRPILDANGQIVAYMQVPQGPQAPMPSKNQQVGRTALTSVNAGLGIASVFAPPLLPVAAVGALVQTIDSQLGNPLSEGVGAVTRFVGQAGETVFDGVVSVGRGIGNFVGGIFGGKKPESPGS